MQRLNSLKREAVVLKRHGSALQMHVSWGGGTALTVGTGSAKKSAGTALCRFVSPFVLLNTALFLAELVPPPRAGVPAPGHMHLWGAIASFQNDGESGPR